MRAKLESGASFSLFGLHSVILLIAHPSLKYLYIFLFEIFISDSAPAFKTILEYESSSNAMKMTEYPFRSVPYSVNKCLFQ